MPDTSFDRRPIGADNGHSIQTRTGVFVDLVNPRPESIHLVDMADAGAKINRFTGHTVLPYSINQHQDFCSRIVSRAAAPYAFLHDGHEDYTGDDSTPKKIAQAIILARELGVPVEAAKRALRVMSEQLDAAIFTRFGLPWPAPPEIWAEVKRADAIALATERRDLMADERLWSYPLPEPHQTHLKPWPWPQAADRYLTRAKELGLS